MTKRLWIGLCIVIGLVAIFPSMAEDIDLFIQAKSSSASEASKVLIVLDNAAGFSADANIQCRISSSGVVSAPSSGTSPDATYLSGKSSGIEQCALYSVIKALVTSTTATLHLGFMVFNENGQKDYDLSTGSHSSVSNCGTEPGFPGGCLVLPFTPMTPDNQAKILAWIKKWALDGSYSADRFLIKSNNLQSGGVLQEAWAYFNGKTGVSGRNYSGVAPASGCGKNTVIFIGNAWRNNVTPNDQTGNKGPKNSLFGTNSITAMNASPAATSDERKSIQGTLGTQCGVSTLQTSENKGAYALNWANYLKNHGTTVYSVGLLGPTCNAEYAAHLKKMGEKAIGGGNFYPTNNYEELKAAINEIFIEIQAVNSVFASVSLPVSVNTQGTYLNQVYVGLFRPAEQAKPLWLGNMKQYKLGLIDNELKMFDADDQLAINTQSGFLKECGRSFWTPGTKNTYWENAPIGECPGILGSAATREDLMKSDFPDGNIVEKGAQAYKTRSLSKASDRVMYTCSSDMATCATTSTLDNFTTTLSTSAYPQSLFDSTGTIARNTLIEWGRGGNVLDELSKGASAVRPSVHGDVMHSRPVAINHGTDAAPSVVVYYGANDGTLRAINGNRDTNANGSNTSIGSVPPGGELWSFMPPEFFPSIKRLYQNAPTVSYLGNPFTDAQPKPYGMDGPITAYQNGAQVSLFTTMRRGGRAVYAFDVSTPASPTLLWKKGCPNGVGSDAGCSDGFTGIGQTWGAVKPLKAVGYGAGASPMVIMGGGYDPCEDYDAKTAGGANHNCSSSTKGNKIYVLDAGTGAIVKTLDTDRSVVADVTIVRDSAGLALFGYAADLGGNVYRISFGTAAPADWTIRKIASLGCDTTSTCTANRKFMFAPGVVALGGGIYGILIGSGDREKPIKDYVATQSVTNYFFMLQDKPSDSAWLASENSNCGAAVVCRNSLLAITSSATPSDTDLAAKKGWYLTLTSTEQVVTSAITIYGVVSFSTHQPAVPVAGSCKSNLGDTRVYNIGYADAKSANGTAQRYEDVVGDGLPPPPVAGLVTLDNGKTVPFCIGCNKDSPLEAKLPSVGGIVKRPKGRTYWYIQK